MSEEKILDRIRKLLALAQSDNVHEAAAAAGKAQDLIEQHNIDRALLEVDKPNEALAEDVCEGEIYTFDTSRLETWLMALASGVTDANGCSYFFRKRRVRDANDRPTSEIVSKLVAIGTPTNIDICRDMMAWLADEVERLRKAEERSGVRGELRAWRNGFRVGAASEISARLMRAKRELRKKLLADAQPERQSEAHLLAIKDAAERGDVHALIELDRKVTQPTGYALARVETAIARLDAEKDKVVEFEKGLGLKKTYGTVSLKNNNGFERGREAGKRAQTSPGKRLPG